MVSFHFRPFYRVMRDNEIPPERVEQKFEQWEERYSVEKLEELTLEDLDIERLAFDSEVAKFRTQYNPGRLVTPAMAAAAGKEPLTQNEFREVRRLINEKARDIRFNFKRAKGRREELNQERRNGLIADVAGRVSDSLTDVSVSFELPKLR